MTNRPTIFLLLLAGCASAPAAPSATAPAPLLASTSAQTMPALDVWYRVESNAGPGLSVGSGLRLRTGGYDVVSRSLAQAMNGSCASAAEAIECDVPGAPMRLASVDGRLRATSGPIELVLTAASADETAAFETTLARRNEAAEACHALATCCVDAENASGADLGLGARLGDRTAESCRAGLAALRATLHERGIALPASCQ